MPEPESDSRQQLRRVIFAVGILICLLAFVIPSIISPPIALAIGLLIGMTVGNPYPKETKKWTKILLQASVVGLGFGIDLGQVLQAGRDGILFTIATIFGTLILGALVGKWLGLSKRTSHLISSGTAICGGSAIAAVGPVLNADEKEMSVALGTIFILNSIALFLFPAVGHALLLTQKQFGIWAAIAIHDTSSVVGAATAYGKEAAGIATTVKLARALWIVPLVLFTSFAFRQKDRKITIPWFIGYFFIASVLRTYVAPITAISKPITDIAKVGLTVTLFLIGAGLSIPMLKSVGVRPLVHGVILWIVISLVSLYAVLHLI
ncbi:MAG: rane protein [Chlorobi bacterium]|nr:rane protein [Chlorobiota bacterium]